MLGYITWALQIAEIWTMRGGILTETDWARKSFEIVINGLTPP